MGSYWGSGRTLSRHDSKKFEVSLLIEYILHFLLSHPPPFYLDDMKCFVYVLMMFSYQPCLG